MPLPSFLYQWCIISISSYQKRQLLQTYITFILLIWRPIGTIILCPKKRSFRATITLYSIGRPVRANITLYPGIVILLVICNISEYE